MNFQIEVIQNETLSIDESDKNLNDIEPYEVFALFSILVFCVIALVSY